MAAFHKGKGKGRRGGGGGPPFRPALGAKGGGKGGAGGGKGGAGGGGKGGFTGTCFYCGEAGHRRSECAKYTAHLKGGGGATSTSLNQVGYYGTSGLYEEDPSADFWPAAGDEDFAPVLNGDLGSLSVEIPTSNAFSALAEEEEEAGAASPPDGGGACCSEIPRRQRGGALRSDARQDRRSRGRSLRSGQRGRALRSGVKRRRLRGNALRPGSREGRAGPALHGGLGGAHWRLPGCPMPSACGQVQCSLEWKGANDIGRAAASGRFRPGADASDPRSFPATPNATWWPSSYPCKGAARLPQSIGSTACGLSLRAGLADGGGPRRGASALQPRPAWVAPASRRLEVDHGCGRQRG